ncbi:MAG: FYDLN acid domain-containing protein [Azospirillaceae bacterium]
MPKADLGIKRICHACGTRYYDFAKTPVICPSCGVEFDPEAFLKSRRGRTVPVDDKPAKKPSPKRARAEDDEEEEEEAEDDETVVADDEEEEEVVDDTDTLDKLAEDVPVDIGDDDEDDTSTGKPRDTSLIDEDLDDENLDEGVIEEDDDGDIEEDIDDVADIDLGEDAEEDDGKKS